MFQQNRIIEKRTPSCEYVQRHRFNQPIRTTLVHWIHEVAVEYVLHRQTFFLAIELLDRYLSMTAKVEAQALQSIAATMLIMAAKINEQSPLEPMKLMLFLNPKVGRQDEQTRSKVIQVLSVIENKMVTDCDQLLLPTVLDGIFLLHRIISRPDIDHPGMSAEERTRHLHESYVTLQIMTEKLEVIKADAETVKYPNSLLATTIYMQHMNTMVNKDAIRLISGYSQAEIEHCQAFLRKFDPLWPKANFRPPTDESLFMCMDPMALPIEHLETIWNYVHRVSNGTGILEGEEDFQSDLHETPIHYGEHQYNEYQYADRDVNSDTDMDDAKTVKCCGPPDWSRT
ncbi:G1/S-specific cyclin-E1 [Quaeritorhiza haematococci]|nr:G1/S-specific cyclin-E1 [Quaeritorhiza haematococci]